VIPGGHTAYQFVTITVKHCTTTLTTKKYICALNKRLAN